MTELAANTVDYTIHQKIFLFLTKTSTRKIHELDTEEMLHNPADLAPLLRLSDSQGDHINFNKERKIED